MSDTTAGATIYYSINKSETLVTYTGPIQVSTSETISAFRHPGSLQRAGHRGLHHPACCGHRPLHRPSSIPGGTYTSPQTLTMTAATAGAMIYYTTDWIYAQRNFDSVCGADFGGGFGDDLGHRGSRGLCQ